MQSWCHQLCIKVVHELLLIAQLIATGDETFQGWVDSRNPEELCEIYRDGMIPANMLPGGRAETPCGVSNLDNPMDYIPH
jgi:hypothetical protein